MGSRFTCRWLENGNVVLSEPPLPRRLGAARDWALILTVGALVVLFSFPLVKDVLFLHRWVESPFLVLHVLALTLCAAAIAEARVRRTRPTVIEAGPEGVRKQEPRLVGGLRLWPARRIRQVKVSIAIPGIGNGRLQMFSNVELVMHVLDLPFLPHRWGPLVRKRSVAECQWLAQLITTALGSAEMSTIAATTDSSGAPDRDPLSEDLQCPLCNYNLRGLVEPRCPECGFAFQWQELLDARRNRHPYLFEYQTNHNVWSFWKTYWNDCRPRRFWRELSPAQPVRTGRLLLYWVLANLVLVASVLGPLGPAVVQQYSSAVRVRSMFEAVHGSTGMYQYKASYRFVGAVPITAAQLDRMYPLPSSFIFWKDLVNTQRWSLHTIEAPLTVLVWPWATLASLLVFQASMRRASINKVHLLRAAIYSCDFSFLFIVLATFTTLFSHRYDTLIEPVSVVCAAVTLYRLTFAYQRYLRFHVPFLTALASQLMVFLAAVCVQLNVQQSW